MRSLPILLVVAACGGRPAAPTLPRPPAVTPARDLGAARQSAPHAAPKDGTAQDPRVVDLDIVRITAHETQPGGPVETEEVATADLFRQAGEAAKSGQTEQAIGIYRRIVSDFPESRFAPVSLFDIAAIYDGRGDPSSTITTLRELVSSYPHAREAVEGQLYIAALQAEQSQYGDAVATLAAALARTDLTYADRLEAYARQGYCLVELKRYDEAGQALDAAVAAWRQIPHLDDPYYIAMAYYYRGEIAHRRFQDAPVRLPDDQLFADMEHKRELAVQAYDLWKQALGFKQAYWATAAGYQMSQIFVELWQATVKAPYPSQVATDVRAKYVADVHQRMHEDLEKALEGHRMNIELAKAFGVETTWSQASGQRASEITGLLAQEAAGQYTPPGAAPSIQ